MAKSKLPRDGTRVTAQTYPSDEYDRPAQEVRGILQTREVPFGTQCWVNGVQVDPDTVTEIDEPS